MAWISVSARGVVLNVHAVPRSSKNAVQGLYGNAVKIRLRAPPVDGKANKALLSFMGEALDIPARQVSIITGLTGRKKRVLIDGLNAEEVRSRLGL